MSEVRSHFGSSGYFASSFSMRRRVRVRGPVRGRSEGRRRKKKKGSCPPLQPCRSSRAGKDLATQYARVVRRGCTTKSLPTSTPHAAANVALMCFWQSSRRQIRSVSPRPVLTMVGRARHLSRSLDWPAMHNKRLCARPVIQVSRMPVKVQ